MGSVIEAIEQTIHKYGFLFDEGEAGRIGECFTPDGKFGPDPTAIQGRDAINADMTKKRTAPHYADGSRPMHINTNVYVIEEDGHTARTHTYWQMFRVSPDGKVFFNLHGSYRDVFEKVDGQWLIKHRIVSSYSRP